MSVYIDPLMPCLKNSKWKHSKSCHLIADSEEELKLFAIACGLKEEWYQEKSFPHFDLTAGKRRLARQRGAIELTTRDFVKKMRFLREGDKFK